ncbi:hypothetical protein A3K86_14505 [Photobacterium jeanii]|uniref:Cobalamin biosynthesis protein CobT n=1 Tax=Photobacterium jeanii TaxID=858640 RepID=A0A178K8U6_9GAMM|nr:tetratricopeptide repeat protein [Photobacterium jeanii]OAN13769.1 hypothetical protein A3K86_14505 [Photobacterium jeanii]PST88890.1 sel1 repeat family protein [Photobacterium jeanii]
MKNYSKQLMLAAICSAGLLTGCASTYEDGLEAYQEGDRAKAQEIWLGLAQEGNIDAMYGVYEVASYNYNQVSDENLTWLQKAADGGLAKAQYQYGREMFKRGSYKAAFTYMDKAAKQLYPQATQFLDKYKRVRTTMLEAELEQPVSMYNLGYYYSTGARGLTKSKAKAAEWYQKAADKGDAFALNNLAIFYQNGVGVTRDYAKAIDLYKKAIDVGSKTAFYNLGRMYQDGTGVARNYSKAKAYFQKGAEKGEANAQNSLANLYTEGKGVERDHKKAYEWYLKAAAQNQDAAQYNLGNVFYFGRVGEPDFAQAANWYRKAAKQGYMSAQANLAIMYAEGEGVPQDYKQSIYWGKKAAAQGSASAQYGLGNRYYFGQGVKKNRYTAVRWYEKAAKQGDSKAQFSLGNSYAFGDGNAKNEVRALQWYNKAAKQGHITAQYNLGVMYSNGEGTKRDYDKAISWYKKAANAGHASAQNNLGLAYQYGRGVKKNYAWATYWFAKSAQQGNNYAKGNIDNALGRLNKFNVAKANTEVFAGTTTSSKLLKRIAKNELVYSLGSQNGWTEVYYPSDYTLGYVKSDLLKTKSATRPKKTASANYDPYPARPQAKSGFVTCNTKCTNGNCYRTYSDGRKVHFQAKQKWNPFTSQFEWDSGGC